MLSQAEEMLISAVMPIMSIYRLPHGQLGYKGHVINFPQKVTAFLSMTLNLNCEFCKRPSYDYVRGPGGEGVALHPLAR